MARKDQVEFNFQSHTYFWAQYENKSTYFLQTEFMFAKMAN